MNYTEIARIYKVSSRQLYNWRSNGVPRKRLDDVGEDLIKRARMQGCLIQGTKHQIKTNLRRASYFMNCLSKAFPGIEE